MNLSFAGCGFLGIYHVGVAVCFKKYAPHLLLEKISGASAGALAACCLLCDLPLGEMTSDFFRVVNEARAHSLGPFSPSFNIQTCLIEGLQKFLPDDAHLRVNGRLHISLTRVYDGKNVIVSQFNSRDDLLQALLCACFIPMFSGILPPRFHGVRYIDGAFSDNLPTLDENTVTVSPFCGESDICPRDQSSQLFHVNWANTSIELSKQNINRFVRILFPPKPEILSNMCQQGFDDALRFLHRNNLISCTRCLAVQSTFIVSESMPEIQDYDPECKECIQHRRDALGGNLPDTVLTVFQTYIESANKGLANWVFRHRGAKLLQALSLPATLPADFVCATFTNIVGDNIECSDYRFKILANVTQQPIYSSAHHSCGRQMDHSSRIVSVVPAIGYHLWNISKYVLDQLTAVINSKQKQKMMANISCQLSLTEYGQANINSTQKQSTVDLLMDKSNCKEMIPSNYGSSDVDAFEHILEVSNYQEAVYAYYYMDENNKVKVTEIYDMTDIENPSLQTESERECNQQLEFETDWEGTQPDYMPGGLTESYFGSNMIQIDENDDFNDYSLFDTNKWPRPSIEEMTDDDIEMHLKPEADQPPTYLSESANSALLRPMPHNLLNYMSHH